MQNGYKKVMAGMILMAVVGTSQAATPLGQSIFNRLKELAGVPSSVNLVVGKIGGSHTDGYTVSIDKGDIALCRRNQDCVAFIMGHELGHIAHHDNESSNKPGMEKNADLFGVALLQKAGMNSCAGADIFRLLQKKYGDGDGDGVHPKNSERARYVDEACHK